MQWERSGTEAEVYRDGTWKSSGRCQCPQAKVGAKLQKNLQLIGAWWGVGGWGGRVAEGLHLPSFPPPCGCVWEKAGGLVILYREERELRLSPIPLWTCDFYLSECIGASDELYFGAVNYARPSISPYFCMSSFLVSATVVQRLTDSHLCNGFHGGSNAIDSHLLHLSRFIVCSPQ